MTSVEPFNAAPCNSLREEHFLTRIENSALARLLLGGIGFCLRSVR
jgi:hypothetical protein